MIYSLREAAQVLGRSYSQVWHAYAYGRLRWPRRVGRTFVLTSRDLAALKAMFDNKAFDNKAPDACRDPAAGDARHGSRL